MTDIRRNRFALLRFHGKYKNEAILEYFKKKEAFGNNYMNDALCDIVFTENNYSKIKVEIVFTENLSMKKKIHQISHKKFRQIDELKGNFFSTRKQLQVEYSTQLFGQNITKGSSSHI